MCPSATFFHAIYIYIYGRRAAGVYMLRAPLERVIRGSRGIRAEVYIIYICRARAFETGPLCGDVYIYIVCISIYICVCV